MKKDFGEFLALTQAERQETGEKIRAFFASYPDLTQEARCAFAMEQLTERPFAVMERFHNWAFGAEMPEKDAAAYLAQDKQGHIGMSGGAIAAQYDEAAPTPLEERIAYFQGISMVFPCMLLGGYHRWRTDGAAEPSYEDFMNAYLPAVKEAWEGAMAAAYRAGDWNRLGEIYAFLATAQPMKLLESYYDWACA